MTAADRLDALLSAYAAGQAGPGAVSAEEVCRDCPELLPELRQRIAAAGFADGLMQSTGLADALPNSTVDWPVPDAAGGPVEFPDRLGDYRVRGVLGRGGMGAVLLADDPTLGRQVAVKVMLAHRAADPTARDRFLREARAAAAVRHDHVVPIFHVGEQDGMPFLVMPLLEGESLEARLRRGPLPPDEVARVGREAAEGLAAAHAAGLVHRDVKPANLWLEGPAGRVRVLDFGLARSAAGADTLSHAGLVIGTPAYMAPEQARGEKVDGRADLFSLGAVLYRAATGQPAFSGPSVTAVLTAIATHDPPPAASVNPAIPAALSTLIGRLLAKNPDHRPRSAREVADALAAINTQRPASQSARKRWGIWAGVLLALGVGAVVTWALLREPQPEGPGSGGVQAPTPVTPPGEPRGTPRPEPLRVKSLDVTHYEKTPERDILRGVIGWKSFAPRLGDRVQMVATLTRPGYAYIIAFQPDGDAVLCFPDDEDTAPPLTDTPRYPADGGKRVYGLREGTGLWVFAVVATEKQLPPYRQWLAGRKPNWRPAAAPVGSVWWYDGIVLEELVEGRRTQRGKDEELTGPVASVLTVGQWLKQTPEAAISVVGFGVGAGK